MAQRERRRGTKAISVTAGPYVAVLGRHDWQIGVIHTRERERHNTHFEQRSTVRGALKVRTVYIFMGVF